MIITRRGLRFGPLILSPEALFGLALLSYLGPGPVECACIAAAALHEGGHLLACLALGIPVNELRLTLLGAVLETDGRCGSGWEEAAVALAGPLVNLGTIAPALWGAQPLLAGTSALLGTFNLLPVAPLDGSRILHGLLSLGGDLERADALTQSLSRWGTGALLALGAVLGALGNRSLLLVALWMMLRGRGANPCAETEGRRSIWRSFSAGLYR